MIREKSTMLGHVYMMYCLLSAHSNGIYIGKSNKPFEHPQAHWRDYLKRRGDESQYIVQAIAKHGVENFRVYCLESCIPYNLLNERERFYILQFGSYGSGYNLTPGGDGFDSETAREVTRQRVNNGSHPFLGENNPNRTPEGRERCRKHTQQLQRRRISDGTHNWLAENRTPEYRERSKQQNIEKVSDGSHHFLTPEHQKRVREAHLKRVSDGTHHFFDPEHAERNRQTQLQRLENGDHPFLQLTGENNPSSTPEGKERLKQENLKRVSAGTHNFLGKNRDPESERKRKESVQRYHARKRHKSYWCYIVALSRFWYEVHPYTTRRSVELPDTSNAEQISFL